MKDEWVTHPAWGHQGQFRYDGGSAALYFVLFFYFSRVLDDMAVSTWQCKSRTEEWWNEMHEWKHHAKACRSARGWSLLSPTPLNVVQHLQLAQCLCVEVVNQWELGRQSHSSVKIWRGTLTNHSAHVCGWKKSYWPHWKDEKISVYCQILLQLS